MNHTLSLPKLDPQAIRNHFRAQLRMEVRPGCEAGFETAWLSAARVVAEEPGNLRQSLSRCTEAGSSYVITTDWSDEESFRRFGRSRARDELTARLRDLRLSASMTTCTVLREVSGKSG